LKLESGIRGLVASCQCDILSCVILPQLEAACGLQLEAPQLVAFCPCDNLSHQLDQKNPGPLAPDFFDPAGATNCRRDKKPQAGEPQAASLKLRQIDAGRYDALT